MEIVVGDSGEFKWTSTESVSVLEMAVHYITAYIPSRQVRLCCINIALFFMRHKCHKSSSVNCNSLEPPFHRKVADVLGMFYFRHNLGLGCALWMAPVLGY